MRILLFLVAVFPLLAHAADPISFTVGEFEFERPSEWKSTSPSSPMRKAHLIVPGTDGSSADVVFFYFGAGQGGSVQANVDRWLGQFENPVGKNVTTAKVGTTNVTTVSARGTFQSGMPGTPTTPLPGFALRGAILESPEGDVYVKMTGPAELVEAAARPFDEMVQNAATP